MVWGGVGGGGEDVVVVVVVIGGEGGAEGEGEKARDYGCGKPGGERGGEEGVFGG